MHECVISWNDNEVEAAFFNAKNEFVFCFRLVKQTYEINGIKDKFNKFVCNELPHKIVYDGSGLPNASISKKLFIEKLDWINENCKRVWSFRINWRDLTEMYYVWSFEDRTDALMFKLSN